VTTLAVYLTYELIGTLTRIASFPGGAEGVVTAKLLNDVRNGLHSTSYLIQLSTCDLLRELVGHESVVQAVIAVVPREDIIALSRYGSHLSSLTPKLTLVPRNLWFRERATGTLRKLDATLERIVRNSRNQ
jgi:hypothetical protein